MAGGLCRIHPCGNGLFCCLVRLKVQPMKMSKLNEHYGLQVPRRGMKKAEYQKNPDTIRSLYDAMKAGDEDAQARLWGLAEQWTPEPWTSPKGQVYQPSEADLKCRKALDLFLEHEKKAKQ